MTHLFKLKKDGKTVGYCEWTEDWGWKYYNDLNPESKFTHFMVAQTGLTAHPFVCKDKNSKDVFANDPIWFHWRGKKTEGKIIKEGLFWKYESHEGYNRTLCNCDLSHIELIEEKK